MPAQRKGGERSLSNRFWARVRSALLVFCAASACTDAVPTSDNPDLIPVGAETVELRLPLSVITSGVQTYSGFSSPNDLPVLDIAHEWGGALEARVLLQFGGLPAFTDVTPPGSNTAQRDSAYVQGSGRLVIRIDTLRVFGPEPFEVELGAVETAWDRESTTWDLATDSLGGSEPWPEAGGGPARFVDRASWSMIVGDSSTIDSLAFSVDSATISQWTDTLRSDRGARISAVTSGSRFRFLSASLRVDARSEVNPDTIIILQAESVDGSSIYSPGPTASPGVLQIGGTPAIRAVFELQLAETLDRSSAELCTQIECPFVPESDRLAYGSLVLHSHQTVSPGLHPLDSVFVELREVLIPERLPRSPLSAPVQDFAGVLVPERFTEGAEAPYEIPITGFLRQLLRADSLETDPLATLALLVTPEPAALDVASFYGIGTELEPYLRLIWTVSDEPGLP